MEITRILWPTDLSGNAEYARPYVQSLSEKYHCEVHVLYVIKDIANHEPWYGEFDEERIDKILEWEKEKAEKRLEQICDNYLQGCPLYIRHTKVGDPAREILNLAEKEQVDLIVMSVKGENAYFGYGSVAEKVSRNAGVPVMSVPVP